MTVDERLAKLCVELPAVTTPLANYVPAKLAGDILMVSGQLPMAAGKLTCKGVVGRDVTVAEAKAAARLCAINLLAAAKSVTGSLDVLEAVRVEGFVASADGFTEQPAVINGASDFFVEVLGDKGRHARIAVGMAALPLGAAVEVAAVFKVTK